MNTICLMCPRGGPIEIPESDGIISVTGNTCKRGESYGISEYTSPKRVITSLINLQDGGVVSVKTNDLVDKAKIFDILNELSGVVVSKPVKIGDIIVKNILGTGVDIVATREA